jgi:hypothetical protein
LRQILGTSLFFRLAVDVYCSLFSGSCTIMSGRAKEGNDKDCRKEERALVLL